MPASPDVGSDAALVGVVLAAGAGTRLRPLTLTTPKVLVGVGGRTLLDRAIADVAPHAQRLAVNAHHHASQIVEHVATHWPGVHVEVEAPQALGTAGAIANLRPWIGGCGVLIANGDAYRTGGLEHLVTGWDATRPRLLVVSDASRGDFGPWRFAGASLLPWQDVERLEVTPSGLYEVCWADAERAGRLELVEHPGVFIDCGTPADHLRASFAAATEGAAVRR